MWRKSKEVRALILLSSLLISILTPTQSRAGDGKSTEIFSVQFNTETSFAPQISVPPQNDNYGAFLVLPPCINQIKNDCIVSIEFTNPQGKWLKGKFKEMIPLKDLEWSNSDFKNDYDLSSQVFFAKARPSQNFPEGGRTSIWQLPGAEHDGGSDYAITLGFPGGASNIQNPRAEGSTISWNSSDGLNLKLFPISYDLNSNISSCGGGFGKASYRCVDSSIQSFPDRTKYRITANFRVTKSMVSDVNWYVGRIINSQITQASNSDGSITLSIEGSPTSVGTVQTEFLKNQENYEILKKAYEIYWQESFGEKPYSFRTYEEFAGVSGTGFKTNDPGTASAWRILEEKFEFKYLNEEPSWQVSTSRVSNEDKALTKKCGGSALNPGIISTNAIAANPSPPKWNPATNDLTYSIASPHTRKDGSLNVGVYELSIDRRLAECLWGSDILQYRASISITTPDGTQKVATTLFSATDKALAFRATGFTYSTSVVKVKLEAGKGSSPITGQLPDFYLPTSSKSPTKTAVKKVITCVKGKVQKKISGTKPVCPKGYTKVP